MMVYVGKRSNTSILKDPVNGAKSLRFVLHQSRRPAKWDFLRQGACNPGCPESLFFLPMTFDVALSLPIRTQCKSSYTLSSISSSRPWTSSTSSRRPLFSFVSLSSSLSPFSILLLMSATAKCYPGGAHQAHLISIRVQGFSLLDPSPDCPPSIPFGKTRFMTRTGTSVWVKTNLKMQLKNALSETSGEQTSRRFVFFLSLSVLFFSPFFT